MMAMVRRSRPARRAVLREYPGKTPTATAAAAAVGAAAALVALPTSADTWLYRPLTPGSWDTPNGWQDLNNTAVFINSAPIGGDALILFNGSAGTLASLIQLNSAYLPPGLNSLAIDTGNTVREDLPFAALVVSGPTTIGSNSAGTFIQTAGSNNLSGGLRLGNSATGLGTYALNAGTLSETSASGSLLVGNQGIGVFNQSGGTHTLDGSIGLGLLGNSSGTYTLSGGTLAVGDSVYISNASPVPSNFIQTGGSHSIATDLFIAYGASTTGVYSLSSASGPASLTVGRTLVVGANGNGTFTQVSGSTHILANPDPTTGLLIGQSPTGAGTATLAGGTLQVDDEEHVGYLGPGTFIQTGGSHSASTLFVGSHAPGAFSMTNGTLAVTGTLYVGFNSTGAFTQSAGAVSAGRLVVDTLASGTAGTLIVNGGSFIAGPTTNNAILTFAGGTASLGILCGSGTTRVTGPATVVSATSANATGTLQIDTGATLNLASYKSRFTANIASLQLSGASTLDIANHELVTSTSPAAIRSALVSAYTLNGDWSGKGLTSSVARTNPDKYTIGYAVGSDASAQDAGVSLKNGTPLATNKTITRATLVGDANLDGKVDFFDISQVLGYKYNAGGNNASYTDGDLDYNGKVDFFDLSLILSSNYNTGETYLGAATKSAGATTPSLTGKAIAAGTTHGVTGDAKPDFSYNPGTGDVTFFADGATFTTTGGQASFVSSLVISSASGMLLPGGASAAFAGGTGATLTSTLLSSALTNSPGFTDQFDLGAILPAHLPDATLLADLTVKYQSLNGGSLKIADLLIPEPTGLGLMGLGAIGALGRKRRKRRA
jgi:hypothetical protein